MPMWTNAESDERTHELRNTLFVTYPPDPLPLLREGGSKEREGLRPSLKSLPPLLLTCRQDRFQGEGFTLLVPIRQSEKGSP